MGSHNGENQIMMQITFLVLLFCIVWLLGQERQINKRPDVEDWQAVSEIDTFFEMAGKIASLSHLH